MWEPGPAGIEEPLRRSLDAEAIDDCGAQLARAPIGSTDDLLAVADGLGIVSQAKGLQLATDGLTRELRGTVSDDSLVRSATIAALNRHVLQAARDRLRLITPGAESSGGLSTDAIAWAHTMERAASANLAYFRSVSIEEMAKAMGLSVEAVTATMGSRDLTFVLAQASMTALPDLQDALPPGDAGDVAALGTSIGVYAQTSALIAKAYSLKLIIDERGDIRGVEDTASLDRLVEIAASSARANIAAAREAGLKTTVPSFYYIAARTYSDGSVDEKVEALQAYWQASLYARVGTLVEQAR